MAGSGKGNRGEWWGWTGDRAWWSERWAPYQSWSEQYGPGEGKGWWGEAAPPPSTKAAGKGKTGKKKGGQEQPAEAQGQAASSGGAGQAKAASKASPGKGGAPSQKGEAGGKAAPPPPARWDLARQQAEAAGKGDEFEDFPWYYLADGELLRVPYPYNMKEGWPETGPDSLREISLAATKVGCSVKLRARGARHTNVMLTIVGPPGCTRCWYSRLREATRKHLPDGRKPRTERKVWVVPIVQGKLEKNKQEEEAAPASDDDDDTSDDSAAGEDTQLASPLTFRSPLHWLSKGAAAKKRGLQQPAGTSHSGISGSAWLGKEPMVETAATEVPSPTSPMDVEVAECVQEDEPMPEAAPGIVQVPGVMPPELKQLYDV
jgi:hypothetical protein